ncbi:TPA: lipid IV(A) 4-amino-4-deoxy-L-arabinosyltransferase [Salmonella enterica]|nr:lipid IV(A) 4-amino-4-deoxy-L-arabinosyltransferase [Salmonella enterica subsp. enterica serovar Montevideo]MCH5723081.1 lipid IV(A) 4-amino-4-deoxy-L-arabinosyltransferase [Salmonella enterica]EGH0794898.1 lipid IV(A) 4-amino-4-deoxy-L-arabinosyltransferase [Salmonella enterica subsp. enterica serovar Montevideo]EJT8386382.1 lipid IV(A) 4-amino-4-deoxy-L-arabinosyltransferase [Salmonella enterica subsp. enterica serovar Montevideo]ELM0668188.1 lipid IV(A) 4-amino-4-deoxy-L-arabinosyltransfe
MKKICYCVSLVVLFALYYLLPLNFRLLWQPDETRYAQISREMLASGDWVVPHFLGVRYFEKPVAGYWLNCIGQWLFGHNNFAVRSGAVFSVTLSALLVAWLAWKIFRDKRMAVLSPVVFLTTLLVYGVGTFAVLDPMLTLWLALAMCCFWSAAQARTQRGKLAGYVLLGMACGMGVMTKGFLALAVPVVGVLPWVTARKCWREVLIYGWVAVAACMLTVLPWGLAIAIREPDFWRYFFWVEHIRRFAEEDAQHKAPFWYYVPFLITGSLPWLAFLPGALKRGWYERDDVRGALYLLGWVVMPFLFFSIAKGKLPTYILPCFVPLSILVARCVLDAVNAGSGVLRINGGINLAFGLAGLAGVLAVSPWGILHRPLWSHTELYKCLLAALAFTAWALTGWMAMQNNGRRWGLAACCPLGIALLAGFVIPDRIIDRKQPQFIIDRMRDVLAPDRYILTNNVGMAAALAWELRRNDIIMYDRQGELRYGLGWPDAKDKFIAGSQFSGWLATHRRQGGVSLILIRGKGERPESLALPEPDKTTVTGRVVLIQYLPR